MSDEMKKRLWTGLCCLIIATAFTSCSESITNPNTPGSRLFNRDVLVRDTILVATSDTTFLQRIAPDQLTDPSGVFLPPLRQNLVGKTGNYTAYSAIRFFPPARDTINVLSARLTLRMVSWRGDSSGTFAFTAHKINANWSQTSLTWDSVSVSGFFESTIRGTYFGTVGADTTVISLSLDTALVRDWYRTGAVNFGLLLMPTTSSSLIRGFHAFDVDSIQFQPKLEVIARNTRNTVTDTTTLQSGTDTYVANVNPFAIANDRVYTQAGIVYRSRISFDVSVFPPGSIINSAELLMERDPAITRVNKFTASPAPAVHALLSNDSSRYESTGANGSLKSGTANTFTFDVRRQVQQWVTGGNFGLVLRQPNTIEAGSLDLYAFHGSRTANPDLRPRIVVKYSVFR